MVSSQRQYLILSFWLGDFEHNSLQNASKWFKKEEAFDQELRERFEEDLLLAIRGEYDSWSSTDEGTLALLLLLDQFSRNIYRNTPQAFSQDNLALKLCLEGLQKKFDRKLSFTARWFFYLPLMHAEDLTLQERSVELFEQLEKNIPENSVELKQALQSASEFALRHLEAIRRFGRFPHRNAILGRETTEEERKFLQDPKNSF